MRTVVLANHGLGDVIMASPLFVSCLADPDDELLIVLKSNHEIPVVTFLLRGDKRGKVIGLRDLGNSLVSRGYRLLISIRSFIPDAIVVTYGVSPSLGALVSLFSGARIRVGPDAGPLRWVFNRRISGNFSTTPGFHKVDVARDCAKLLGRNASAALSESPNHQPDVAALGPRPLLAYRKGSLVALALGGGLLEAHKRLPYPRALELLSGLRRTYPDAVFLLLGGASELSLNSRLATESRGPAEIQDLTAKTTFPELYAVLTRCKVLIATCNGISHVAAFAQCPVIGFYGPTNPDHTGPYQIDLTAIRGDLKCSPCYQRSYPYGCGRPNCMDLPVAGAIDLVRHYPQRPVGTSDLSGGYDG